MPDSEEQLKLYRLLVEHSLGLMCIHDLNGILLSINPAAAEALGYTPQECLGRNIRDLLEPLVQHLFDDYLQRIQSNHTDSGLMRLRAKDGTERIWYYRLPQAVHADVRVDCRRAETLVAEHFFH